MNASRDTARNTFKLIVWWCLVMLTLIIVKGDPGNGLHTAALQWITALLGASLASYMGWDWGSLFIQARGDKQ